MSVHIRPPSGDRYRACTRKPQRLKASPKSVANGTGYRHCWSGVRNDVTTRHSRSVVTVEPGQ
jgi:hypothetical protein